MPANDLPLQRILPPGWPQVWRDLAGVLYAAMAPLCSDRATRRACAACAVDQVKALAQAFGGRALYIPLGRSVAAVALSDAVRRDFQGHNYREVAAMHHVSEMRVRQIISGSSGRARA